MLWPGLIAMKCHIRAVTVTNILAYERLVPGFSLVASRSAWRFAIKGSLISSEIVCKWLSLWYIDYMTLFLKSIPRLVVCYNYTNFYMLICKKKKKWWSWFIRMILCESTFSIFTPWHIHMVGTHAYHREGQIAPNKSDLWSIMISLR